MNTVRAALGLLLLATLMYPGAVRGQTVQFGAEALVDRNFDILHGKRVGLITNHTAVVGTEHLIDLMAAAPEVELVALFGPEHGLRGAEEAGAKVDDAVDAATGVPVFSLYGAQRQPPDSVLAGLDVLVFDIQDVGARFYTYISTMGLSMQAAARAGVPFVVLDRPNPLGRRTTGPIRADSLTSFVSRYPIPVTHGLTIGELAMAIKGEAWLEDLENLDLSVVKVEGLNPSLLWSELDRTWIPTSPNIPTFDIALVYPATCLFEATSWNEGRGTMTPFMHVGFPGIDGTAMAAGLNERALPGVLFEATAYTPEAIPGMSSSPKHRDTVVHGVRLEITDAAAFSPFETGVYMVDAAYQATPVEDRATFFNTRWMALLTGSVTIQNRIESGDNAAEIVESFESERLAFEQQMEQYLLY